MVAKHVGILTRITAFAHTVSVVIETCYNKKCQIYFRIHLINQQRYYFC